MAVQYRNIFGQVPADDHIGKVIWARVQLYFGIVKSTL